jgi:hypothetical protein
MEILRIPSYSIEAIIEVSDPSTVYEYSIKDMADNSVTSDSTTSSSSSKVTIPLPAEYDGSYLITVDETETYVDVVRPYVDPTKHGKSASEIAEYTQHEELARAIIDSVIDEGFYYKKKIIETTGTGADYIPMWIDAKKVLKFYENNVLLFDADHPEDFEKSYDITDDGTAVIESYNDRINRLEGAALILSEGSSDLFDTKYSYRGFPRTFDYKILVAAGYPKLPSDIARAAKLVVEDIACGNLEYYKKYITDYNTDQFKIKFSSQVFEGTGNIIVDKILSKYAKSIRSVGVL